MIYRINAAFLINFFFLRPKYDGEKIIEYYNYVTHKNIEIL